MAIGIRIIQIDGRVEFLILALVLLIMANTLYVTATTAHMLQKIKKIDFLTAMRWRKKHTDFLLFVSCGLIGLSALALYFVDVIFIIRNIIEERQFSLKQNETLPTFNSILLFGSQLASIVFLCITLMLWQYVCRVGIRMPAHVDGYHLRVEEALSLTRGQTLKIVALSFLFITAISTIVEIATNIPLFPKSGVKSASAATALTIPLAYFLIMQLHLALWVSLYNKNTDRYRMQKNVL